MMLSNSSPKSRHTHDSPDMTQQHLTDNITYDTNIFDYNYYGNIVVTAGLSVLLMITLEMPILHIEKLLFGLLGLAGLPRPKRYLKKEKEEKPPDN